MSKEENDKKDITTESRCPEGCSKCCTNILPVSDAEIKRILKYMKDNGIEVINRNNIVSGYVDICPFVNENGKCNVYPVRPEICSYYDCHKEGYRYFNHADKKMVNMLLTFKPGAFCPNAPDVEKFNDLYQFKKKSLKK